VWADQLQVESSVGLRGRAEACALVPHFSMLSLWDRGASAPEQLVDSFKRPHIRTVVPHVDSLPVQCPVKIYVNHVNCAKTILRRGIEKDKKEK